MINKSNFKFDRTFCKAEICVDEKCELRLTKEIEDEAKKINYPFTYITECALPGIVKSQKRYIKELEQQLRTYKSKSANL